MSEEKLEQYFNKLKGKAIETSQDLSDLEELGGSFHKNLVQSVTDSNFMAMGKEKTFSVVSDSKKTKCFAMLKSKKTYSKCEQQFGFNEIDDDIYVNTLLRASGAQVPKLYSMFFADSKYIEIQELAQGKPIAYTNMNFLKHKVLGCVPTYGLTSEEQSKIAAELYSYNLGQQQKLLAMPDDAFDKLLNTYLVFKRMGFLFDDSHAGNILIGKNGFTVVDVDYSLIMQELRNGGYKPSDVDASESFVAPFTNSTLEQYLAFLEPDQKEQLRFNNVEIFKKLSDAISRRGILIDFDEKGGRLSFNSCFNQFKNAIGKERFFMKYDYILGSQIKLREKFGLPKNSGLTTLETEKQKLIKTISSLDHKKFG